MKLTGRCKEEFKKWLNINYKDFGVVPYSIDVYWSVCDLLYKLPQSMQYGVYVDFFDSVGIYISLDWYKSIIKDSEYFETDINNHIDSKRFKTRPEARKSAIEKANELHNEFLNK
tara:strand:+ start:593 stop:937 length:345 start_codon:yes stop_codon:yes gene_type:complete